MEQIIVFSFLVALNVAAAIINYYFENYKVSNFNSFAAGICLMGLIDAVMRFS